MYQQKSLTLAWEQRAAESAASVPAAPPAAPPLPPPVGAPTTVVSSFAEAVGRRAEGGGRLVASGVHRGPLARAVVSVAVEGLG